MDKQIVDGCCLTMSEITKFPSVFLVDQLLCVFMRNCKEHLPLSPSLFGGHVSALSGVDISEHGEHPKQ